MKDLTDARRFYVLMRDAGTTGVHSHELRHRGVSGNPSQRAKDIVSKGVPISVVRENIGKRPGARYFLAEFAPDDATPVRPNNDSGEEPKQVLSLVLDYTGEKPEHRLEWIDPLPPRELGKAA